MNRLFICEICRNYPGSHSFQKISETADGIDIYYTCPSKAKLYNDYDGIMSHYEGVLKNKGDKPWIWIFDCQGFSIKHAAEVKIIIAIAKITNQYSDSLKKIIITNPNLLINTTLSLVMPFLSSRVKGLIHKSNIELKTK